MPRLVPTVCGGRISKAPAISNGLPLHIGAYLLTSPVDREVEVFDRTELSEDFVQVVLVDILGESLYNDLFSSSQLEICAESFCAVRRDIRTLVLLARGPSLSLLLLLPRPRLQLRLSLLCLPLRREGGGVRLPSLEGDRESKRRRLSGDRELADRGVGERDHERRRPRGGDWDRDRDRDREAMTAARKCLPKTHFREAGGMQQREQRWEIGSPART